MSDPTNQQILSAIMDLKQNMGSVQTGVDNAQAHTLAVSKKADMIRDEIRSVSGELTTHKLDPQAHGIEERRRAERRGGYGVAWVIISIVGVVGTISGIAARFLP